MVDQHPPARGRGRLRRRRPCWNLRPADRARCDCARRYRWFPHGQRRQPRQNLCQGGQGPIRSCCCCCERGRRRRISPAFSSQAVRPPSFLLFLLGTIRKRIAPFQFPGFASFVFFAPVRSHEHCFLSHFALSFIPPFVVHSTPPLLPAYLIFFRAIPSVLTHAYTSVRSSHTSCLLSLCFDLTPSPSFFLVAVAVRL